MQNDAAMETKYVGSSVDAVLSGWRAVPELCGRQIQTALATLFSFTGCSSSDDESSESSVDLSNIASAMITEGTTEALTTDYAYIMNDDGTISVSGYTGSDTDLTVPGLIDGYVVTGIADHAFEANADIKSITLPNGLITIGESAFSDCSSLTTVVIPDTVGTIRRGAFISCTALTTLDIPASVTEIMEEAFTGCAALKDLTVESMPTVQ